MTLSRLVCINNLDGSHTLMQMYLGVSHVQKVPEGIRVSIHIPLAVLIGILKGFGADWTGTWISISPQGSAATQ